MRQAIARYPRSMWIMLGVFFLNRAASSLIWPFLTLYMRQSLNAPLEQVTLLVSVQAAAGLLSASVTGAVMDRFGRKQAMVVGAAAWSVVIIAMSTATQFWQWGVLLTLYGIFQPIFYVGSYAMVADMVPPDKRAGAYAIARTVSNLAIAVGPAAGGLFAAATHIPLYHIAAVMNVVMVIPFVLLVGETMPKSQGKAAESSSGGYGRMLRDRPFMSFFAAYLTLELAVTLVFTLMPVYVKESFGIPQEQYSLLLSVNAGMIVAFQVAVTRWTARFRPLPMLVLGAFFYALGLAGYTRSSLLPHFALSMAVMTIGELIVAPTSSSYAANLAPVDMRARYMSIFSTAYTIASGIGPMVGGFLSDKIAPVAIWYGGSAAALLAMAGFALLYRRSPKPVEVDAKPAFEG